MQVKTRKTAKMEERQEEGKKPMRKLVYYTHIECDQMEMMKHVSFLGGVAGGRGGKKVVKRYNCIRVP